jgi:hypothetical protein
LRFDSSEVDVKPYSPGDFRSRARNIDEGMGGFSTGSDHRLRSGQVNAGATTGDENVLILQVHGIGFVRPGRDGVGR